ncbi:hypothetical protein PMW_64 [Pseudomonas phage phiPMW]|uniref:Uncharacterized protein n=1 Tax=Pseudomonas phage phiPMW TaxID=1815582 RepID=A0A1S5R1C3_9CAUD|nr:hypothetical protein FDG97_gp064 [Pseudomonas phage phiPMW]ANA49189.1 hypothetical protein PMW_64 [Pseudomonas phage phiPMW]
MNTYTTHEEHGYSPADIHEMEEANMKMRDALHDVLDWINHSHSLHALHSIVNKGLDN